VRGKKRGGKKKRREKRDITALFRRTAAATAKKEHGGTPTYYPRGKEKALVQLSAEALQEAGGGEKRKGEGREEKTLPRCKLYTTRWHRGGGKEQKEKKGESSAFVFTLTKRGGGRSSRERGDASFFHFGFGEKTLEGGKGPDRASSLFVSFVGKKGERN